MIKKILLTGASGLLGSNWIFFRQQIYQIIAVVHQKRISSPFVQSVAANLHHPQELEKALEGVDFIVHAVGLTHVDGCEEDPERAYLQNAVLAGQMATLAQEHRIPFVHISTDHLFNGQQILYREEDVPSPINIYGKSKLEGEKLVVQACPDALIIRTNFYGQGHRFRQSFSDWIFSGLSQGKKMEMYDNLYYSPIYVLDLIEAIEQLMVKGQKGIFHVVGDERISKYDFGVKLAKVFNFDASLLQRTQYGPENCKTQRPLNMALDNTKVQGLLGKKLGNVEFGLQGLKLAHHEKVAEKINAMIC